MAAVHDAHQVHADDLRELVERDLDELAADGDPGVVDHEVDAPERCEGGVGEALHLFDVRHVDAGGVDAAPQGARAVRGLVQARLVPIAEREVAAPLRQLERRRAPDAARRARHARHPASQVRDVHGGTLPLRGRTPSPTSAARTRRRRRRTRCPAWPTPFTSKRFSNSRAPGLRSSRRLRCRWRGCRSAARESAPRHRSPRARRAADPRQDLIVGLREAARPPVSMLLSSEVTTPEQSFPFFVARMLFRAETPGGEAVHVDVAAVSRLVGGERGVPQRAPSRRPLRRWRRPPSPCCRSA